MSETIATLLKIIIAIALLIALIAFINWGLKKLKESKTEAEKEQNTVQKWTPD